MLLPTLTLMMHLHAACPYGLHFAQFHVLFADQLRSCDGCSYGMEWGTVYGNMRLNRDAV